MGKARAPHPKKKWAKDFQQSPVKDLHDQTPGAEGTSPRLYDNTAPYSPPASSGQQPPELSPSRLSPQLDPPGIDGARMLYNLMQERRSPPHHRRNSPPYQRNSPPYARPSPPPPEHHHHQQQQQQPSASQPLHHPVSMYNTPSSDSGAHASPLPVDYSTGRQHSSSIHPGGHGGMRAESYSPLGSSSHNSHLNHALVIDLGSNSRNGHLLNHDLHIDRHDRVDYRSQSHPYSRTPSPPSSGPHYRPVSPRGVDAQAPLYHPMYQPGASSSSQSPVHMDPGFQQYPPLSRPTFHHHQGSLVMPSTPSASSPDGPGESTPQYYRIGRESVRITGTELERMKLERRAHDLELGTYLLRTASPPGGHGQGQGQPSSAQAGPSHYHTGAPPPHQHHPQPTHPSSSSSPSLEEDTNNAGQYRDGLYPFPERHRTDSNASSTLSSLSAMGDNSRFFRRGLDHDSESPTSSSESKSPNGSMSPDLRAYRPRLDSSVGAPSSQRRCSRIGSEAEAAQQLVRLRNSIPPAGSSSTSKYSLKLAKEVVESLIGTPGDRDEKKRAEKADAPSYMNPNQVCQVCKDDKATGMHYHIITCEGCKGFFRRCIQKNLREKLKCKNTTSPGLCLENICKANRNSCQYCRLQKCFEAGMAEDLVLNEEKRVAKNELKARNRLNREIRMQRRQQDEAALVLNGFKHVLLEYSMQSLQHMEALEKSQCRTADGLPRTVTAGELMAMFGDDMFNFIVQPYLNLTSNFCEHFQQNFFGGCELEKWEEEPFTSDNDFRMLLRERILEVMFIYVTRTYAIADRAITFLGIRIPRAEVERLPDNIKCWLILFYNMVETSRCTWKSNEYLDSELSVCLVKSFTYTMGSLPLKMTPEAVRTYDQIGLSCEQLDQLFQRKRYTPDRQPIFSFGLLPAVSFREEFSKAIVGRGLKMVAEGKHDHYPIPWM